MFIILCNIYLWQSLGSLLKNKTAQAKKKKVRAGLAWIISMTNLKSEPCSAPVQKQVGYPRWAWFKLGSIWDFQARLRLGHKSGFELSLSSGWKRKFLAQYQSVASWLKLELAQAKKLELGWLSSARRPSQNPSLAWIEIENLLNFQAEPSLGSKNFRFFKLSSARV